MSDGCNRLIRQGAGPATCPQDILEYFFGAGSEEDRVAERDAARTAKRVSEPSGRIDMDRSLTGEEEQADASRQRIDQQNAEQQEEDWIVTVLKNRDPQNEGQQEEDWEGTEQQQEHHLDQMAPGTLDRRILRLLSTEDEKHIERILEEVNCPDSLSDSVKAEVPVSLQELVSCLMRLKIEGRAEESSAGYYRKI